MIVQIKQDLVEWDELVAKRPDLKGRCGKWPEWVRSLIGEVERLTEGKYELHRNIAEWQSQYYDKEKKVEELQKALEHYADWVDWEDDDMGKVARTALQSIQGGDNT